MRNIVGLILLLLICFAWPVNAQTINTIAGTNYGDGQTAFAIGINPAKQVFDAAGNLYFCEPDRHVIRKLSASGVYSTVAGTGFYGYSGDGGPATAAQLKWPFCIAIDAAGNLFIVDDDDNRIRKVSTNGIITTIAGNGNADFSGDGGLATQAQLNKPTGIAIDNSSNIYIADFSNGRIRRIGANGIITTIAGIGGFGSAGNGGPAIFAQIGLPISIDVNATGEIFIADIQFNNIRKIASNGIINVIAGSLNGTSGFSGDGGPATSALLNGVIGVTTDASGNIFIADQNNNRIRKINSNGIISTIAGNGIGNFSGDGGPAISAQLSRPLAITVDVTGNLFISVSNRIRKVNTTGIITTIAGNGFAGYNGDSLPVGVAQICHPYGVLINKDQNVCWSEKENNLVRKLTNTGTVITIAGTGVSGFSGDGGPATAARLASPGEIATDTTGNVFIADFGNNRIRKINTNGVIMTIAGNGISGFSGDGGLAISAQLNSPEGVTGDKNGNIFIADKYNHRIRKVNPNGIITTIAGNGAGGFSGDGGSALLASLYLPSKVSVDTAGNVLIIDVLSNRIRKVGSTTGIISTVAGNGQYGFSGDGGPAIAAAISPNSVVADSLGNFFIGDGNGYIRKINSDGIISSIAGDGTTYGDGGPATISKIQTPSALAFDKQGNMYITDNFNSRIRKITATNCGSWTGTSNNDWENTQNWTCGVIPDSTTNVIIHSGTIRINSNVTVRTLQVDPGVNIFVGSGYKLIVLK